MWHLNQIEELGVGGFTAVGLDENTHVCVCVITGDVSIQTTSVRFMGMLRGES